MIFHNPPIFVSRSREHVYVLCVCYLGATGKMLFGRIAGSIEFAGSRDLPFDILNLLLPGGSLFLSCLPFFWNLAISLHISGMAHNRGPRRRLAWVGLIEPLYHRHLSSCKHSSREREPGCYRHCYVILIPIISLFLFLFRPAASLTSDSTKSVIFGFFFFSLHLLDWCELARLSCRMKRRTRWLLIWVFVIEGLAWDFGPACNRSQTEILRVPPADDPICSYT